MPSVDILIMTVATLQRSISELDNRLDNVNSGLETLEYQIRTFEHDKEIQYVAEKNLRLNAKVVSMKEYRRIHDHLMDMQFTLLGLQEKRSLLLQERKAIVEERDGYQAALEQRERELDAIQNTKAKVLYFPSPE